LVLLPIHTVFCSSCSLKITSTSLRLVAEPNTSISLSSPQLLPLDKENYEASEKDIFDPTSLLDFEQSRSEIGLRYKEQPGCKHATALITEKPHGYFEHTKSVYIFLPAPLARPHNHSTYKHTLNSRDVHQSNLSHNSPGRPGSQRTSSSRHHSHTSQCDYPHNNRTCHD
jgi:hypothetical protein